MIDWTQVGLAALWIVGLALLVAALSRADYCAREKKRPFTQVLRQPSFQSPMNLGGVCFSAGMAATAQSAIESLLWGLLALFFGIQFISSWQRARYYPKEQQPGAERVKELGWRSPEEIPALQQDHLAFVTVLGVRIHTLAADKLVRFIANASKGERKVLVAYANTHAINLAQQLPWFRDVLNRADVTYCDGFGLKWGARLLGLDIPYRFTPPDWIGQLATTCASEGISIFLLGAKPAVAERAATLLGNRFPGLHLVGTQHGYFDKNPDSVENQQVIQTIKRAQPDILIVGFGMPLQEHWLAENWRELQAKVILPVGALIDYLAGETPRAPRWMTDYGFEWLGRLIVEPRRLWRRYLLGNPQFIWCVLMQRLGIRRPI